MSETPSTNVVFIMTDNQPAELLGCYGNTEIYTPNLDRMARQGLKFNNAYCPNAMCSPCRASALTGLMPSQHGVHTWLDDRAMDGWPDNWNAIEEFETLPEILKRNNFATALIGKYHLGMPYEAQNGFDHWITFGLGHTLSFSGNTMIENGESVECADHSVDYFTAKAVEYIHDRARQPEQPFFLFLPYNAPYGHWPSIKGPADNRFYPRYENLPMTSVPREGLNSQALELHDLQTALNAGEPNYRARLQIPNDLASLRNYYSQMSVIDDGVGKVLEALDESGLSDDTLVIFTADHGFSLGHHGYWGHGTATWPSNMHRASYNIPLLVKHSRKIAANSQTDALVNSIDFFATILDYVGVTNTGSSIPSPARSFSRILKGETVDWENTTFFEQEETRAIRTPEWLLLKRFKGSEAYPLQDELYDLTNDVDERVNVVNHPAHAQIYQLLSDKIDAFFSQYTDPRFDLWKGGAPKSNASRPWLWSDAWGEDWRPTL